MSAERIDELVIRLRKPCKLEPVATELAGFGRAAVDRLITEFADPESEVAHRAKWLFPYFGAEALEPLVTALSNGPTDHHRGVLRCALQFVGVLDRTAFLPYFTHPKEDVRACAVSAFRTDPFTTDPDRDYRAQAVAHADELLTMMDDPVEAVRNAAYNALASVGDGIVPALMRARRTAPKRVRTELRHLLLELVGVQGMDERDRTAIRRLIEIRALEETPEPMHLCGGWFALPASDLDAILAGLDLSDPVPVTMSLGADAWNRDQHEWFGHPACRRMYITPLLDGRWTLVFGRLPAQEHEEDDAARIAAVLDACRRLSARFGEAHWYGESCGDGWTSWCVARGGEVVRYYDVFEPGDAVGEPLPEERGYLLPHEDNPEMNEECYAATLAGRISIDPGHLGPATRFRGRAHLALTSCGRELGMPTGALHIRSPEPAH